MPSAPGMIEKVLEIPSCESINGSFATDESDATKYTKHSDGDCSKIVGYIIQQAYVYDRDASQL